MVKFCPHKDLCFDTGHIILISIATLGMLCYYKYAHANAHRMIENHLLLNDLHKKVLENNSKLSEIDQKRYPMYIRDRDYQRVINPLMPPERSNHTMEGIPINIPSRGEAGSYQQVGVLINKDNAESKILPLYGKNSYPGSRNWLYYTSTDQYQSVKIPIVNGMKDCTDEHGCPEISNGDDVEVPAYNKNFQANIYKFDKPRYIPYYY